MKVFITGGTGFLGAALTEGLLGEGHSVTILSRSSQKGPLRMGLAYCGATQQRAGPGRKRSPGMTW